MGKKSQPFTHAGARAALVHGAVDLRLWQMIEYLDELSLVIHLAERGGRGVRTDDHAPVAEILILLKHHPSAGSSLQTPDLVVPVTFLQVFEG